MAPFKDVNLRALRFPTTGLHNMHLWVNELVGIHAQLDAFIIVVC